MSTQLTKTGKPPRWTPLTRTVRLSEDSGKHFRDRNAAKYAKHPMEPAILAMLDASPELGGEPNIDVVACGSTMGNLLRFVSGQDKLFRILVEVIEDTVFFIRRENSPTELIPNVRGFGHSFPEQYTTWDADVKGSSSHQRVLRYRFGGLRFLLRFEADGYISKTSPKSPKTASASTSPASMKDLWASLDTAFISPDLATSDADLKIKPAGEPVDQSLIFDLKTRSVKKRDVDTLNEELGRLWIAQIPNFILAYHEHGVFNDIRVLNVKSQVKEWERTQKNVLSKLAALVHRIIGMARDRPSGKLEVCHGQVGVLEIREQLPEAGDVLSRATKSRWSARGAAEKTLVDSDSDDGKVKKQEADWENDLIKWDDKWNERSPYNPDGKVPVSDDFTACSRVKCGWCGGCITD